MKNGEHAFTLFKDFSEVRGLSFPVDDILFVASSRPSQICIATLMASGSGRWRWAVLSLK